MREARPEIGGHPVLEMPNAFHPEADAVTITVCAGCGEMRTILFLSGDRWYCTRCRAAGDARPTMIPLAWKGA